LLQLEHTRRIAPMAALGSKQPPTRDSNGTGHCAHISPVQERVIFFKRKHMLFNFEHHDLTSIRSFFWPHFFVIAQHGLATYVHELRLTLAESPKRQQKKIFFCFLFFFVKFLLV
jgi:hypothetical protein